jgi:membrane-bound lytic murein transglycosylase B
MLIRCALAGVIAYVFCLVFSVSVTIAAECQQQDNFSNWLEHFRQEATSQGISQQTIVSALNGISYDPAIIARDHSQNVFQQSFGQFSGRMVSPDRLRKGANMLKRYAARGVAVPPSRTASYCPTASTRLPQARPSALQATLQP